MNVNTQKIKNCVFGACVCVCVCVCVCLCSLTYLVSTMEKKSKIAGFSVIFAQITFISLIKPESTRQIKLN
jgi:hypothetical protein